MLGFRNHSQWLDMSDFVVHFTKPGGDDPTGYSTMMAILSSQILRAGPAQFGMGRKDFGVGDLHRSVCFSEVPLGLLSRLVERRSRYGIGFRKDFLAKNGGAPVWYVPFGSLQYKALEELTKRGHQTEPIAADPIWALTPLIDITGKKPDAPYDYQFEWEREWRVPGDLRFESKDVSMLFIPEELHDAARSFFRDAQNENTGPSYESAFLDGAWDVSKITAVLAEP